MRCRQYCRYPVGRCSGGFQRRDQSLVVAEELVAGADDIVLCERIRWDVVEIAPEGAIVAGNEGRRRLKKLEGLVR